MSGTEFVDTNVLLYLMGDDKKKSQTAERVLRRRPIVSVQVLNECLSVATKRFGLTLLESAELLEVIKRFCSVVPVTIDTHELGASLMKRYGFSTYDAMIVAAALIADCTTLLSEDMHHGLKVGPTLRIRNPFK